MDHGLLRFMLAIGALLLVSIFASKLSSRWGIPVLLVFIAVGMISGVEGFLGIPFNDNIVARNLGTIALSFILFSGGLSTQVRSVSAVWKEGVILALPGVLLTTGIMGLVAHIVFGWGWIPSMLLGACISSTDAAAVFGILKTKKLHLRNYIQATLELESGSNDPMAFFLTIILIQVYRAPESLTWWQLAQDFFIQMSLGGLAGWFFGSGLVKVINWLDLEFEGLYPVLTMAGVACIYALTEYCGGNGFLAVYLSGISMGDEKYFSKKGLEVFHDGLAWLMQVGVFLTLGLLVRPAELADVALPGLLLAMALMFVARPVSVFVCLSGFGYNFKEILYISWAGLRGAVPIIMATYVMSSPVPEARWIFNAVFFIVIVCTLMQGPTLGRMAKFLEVQDSRPQGKLLRPRSWDRELLEFEVSEGSPLIGHTILDLKLPENVLVVLIHRAETDFIPKGNTEIEAYDHLICLADREVIPDLLAKDW